LAVIPAQAGIQFIADLASIVGGTQYPVASAFWIPACAGMTV